MALSEKAREGNRRRNARWKENNPEHVKMLNREKAKRHYHRNQGEYRKKMRERAKARWDNMSPEERRDFKLRQTYGVSLDQFNAQLTLQGNKCAACGTSDPGGRGWQFDHCHTKGHMRGVLCVKCNTGLGLANDDPEILMKWIQYLQQAR